MTLESDDAIRLQYMGQLLSDEAPKSLVRGSFMRDQSLTALKPKQVRLLDEYHWCIELKYAQGGAACPRFAATAD